MKLLQLFLFFCSLFFVTSAQNSTPVYGKVDKAELLMTACDFDPTAEAVVLFESGQYYCDIRTAVKNQVYIQLEKYVRLKILNSKGLEKANIRIRYLDAGEKEFIKKISAQTVNIDAGGNVSITKLDKKLLYNKRVSDRFSEMAFTMPNVQPGSIIEYKYILECVSIPDWYFQKTIPVKESRVTINASDDFDITCIPHCTLPMVTGNEPANYRDEQTYSMINIPALRDEPFITCEQDYLQRLETKIDGIYPSGSAGINLLTSWPGVVTNLVNADNFGGQLKKNLIATDELIRLLKHVTQPVSKIAVIQKYVRDNIEWNGIESITSDDGINAAWKQKKGSSADINLILVNLLKKAGFNAAPVLVSSRDNGKIDLYVADAKQFNKVLAYVKTGNRKYIIDGTDHYTPVNLIPFDVMLTDGLIIEPASTGEWGWQTLWSDQQLNSNDIVVDALIDEQGIMKGDAYITSADYAKVERLSILDDGKNAFIQTYITPSKNTMLKVDSIVFENTAIDSLPLIQKIWFKQPLISTGDYKSFSLNLFCGLTKNIFLSDGRLSDITFGCNQRLCITGSFIIPSGFSFEELPENIRLLMPDTGIVFTRICTTENNHLSVKLTLDFNKPVYTTDEYQAFKEFYKKLFGFLNEPVVIRKTINAW